MPLQYTVDPREEDAARTLTRPDWKQDAQERVDATYATIAALRNRPQYAATVQDATSPVEFTSSPLGLGVRGAYYPKQDKAKVGMMWDPRQMTTTTTHELLHGLQHQGCRDTDPSRFTAPYRNNPLATLDLGRQFNKTDRAVAGGETPRDFQASKTTKPINYGEGEMGAWLASNLMSSDKLDPIVRPVFAENPALATMYAQANAQPNRPMPMHYKGEPEWSTAEKISNKLFGYRPEIDLDDRAKAARSMMVARLLREMNPRERH